MGTKARDEEEWRAAEAPELALGPTELQEELDALRRVVEAYANYPVAAEATIQRWEQSFRWLPKAHQELLRHLPEKYQEARRCIASNATLINAMLQTFDPPFPLPPDASHGGAHLSELPGGAHPAEDVVMPPPWLRINRQRVVPPADADKVRCMLRSIVREWTAEGAQERREAFDPILNELRRKFKHELRTDHPPLGTPPISHPDGAAHLANGQVEQHEKAQPGQATGMPPTCLVPGAGLGRLALEICRLGFSCQGNEFSFYTLICSSFLLNCCASPGQWTLHPWLLSSCNSLSDADQLRPVGVPDDVPSIPLAEDGATPLVDFSMCAGDFVEVYRHPSQKGAWDSVATCFFIDTAHNIVEYLEVIWQVLRPGGVWVNLGPLLYHFAEPAGPLLYLGAVSEEEARKRAEMSVEISLEDVKRVAFTIGFVLEKEQFVETTYSANPKSMMRTQYTCVLWTMIKPRA